MNTIQNMFQQAQLAEAAYANFVNSAGNLIATDAQLITGLTTGNMKFSIAQATDFLTHWSYADQFTDSAQRGQVLHYDIPVSV